MHVEHVFHDLPIGCVDMDTVCNWGLCCAASQSFGLVFSLFYFVWGSKAAAGAHLVSVVVRRLVAGWPTSFLFLLRHHCWPALYVRTISNGVSRYVHASVCESTRNEIQRHLGRALGHRWFIGQRKKKCNNWTPSAFQWRTLIKCTTQKEETIQQTADVSTPIN